MGPDGKEWKKRKKKYSSSNGPLRGESFISVAQNKKKFEIPPCPRTPIVSNESKFQISNDHVNSYSVFWPKVWINYLRFSLKLYPDCLIGKGEICEVGTCWTYWTLHLHRQMNLVQPHHPVVFRKISLPWEHNCHHAAQKGCCNSKNHVDNQPEEWEKLEHRFTAVGKPNCGCSFDIDPTHGTHNFKS